MNYNRFNGESNDFFHDNDEANVWRAIDLLRREVDLLRREVALLREEKRIAVVETPEEKVSENLPLPEEDKTISRISLCSELIRLTIELGKELPLGASPKLFTGEKKNNPRVYFAEDNSFLYFDKWGRLCLGDAQKSKGCVARRVLTTLYAMRDHLPSPTVQGALLKSQFSAFPGE